VLVRVLGSAAGGGFPQWNCGCPNCSGVRKGTLAARARTQECVAVSSDGQRWWLLNASPEVRAQIESFPALSPRGLRDTPLAGVLLTSGDLDHCLGLLSLRESQRLQVYATARVHEGFVEHNEMSRTLQRFDGQVTWQRLPLAEAVALDGPQREWGLEVCALPVPGKPPLHARRREPHAEDNIGLRVSCRKTGAVLAYVPGVGANTDTLAPLFAGASALFFDGTFWSSSELIDLGVGNRRAEDMSHWPVGGASGSLAFLRRAEARQRWLIHVNNTNPILDERSPEHAELCASGVNLAYDGLELTL
jgi:pyrroloquinoline quinone biosynthesis protein B